jgi:hypothetical protein
VPESKPKDRVARLLSEACTLALESKAEVQRVELQLSERIDEVRFNAAQGFRKVAKSHEEILKRLDAIHDHITKKPP